MYKVSEADKLKMNRLEQQVQTVCKAQHCDDLFKHLTTVAQASKALAKQVFEIVDDAILSAICCHTTLKANPSLLDKTVFLADKIKWDGAGQPPYLFPCQMGVYFILSIYSVMTLKCYIPGY